MGKILRFNRKPQCSPQSPWVRDPNGIKLSDSDSLMWHPDWMIYLYGKFRSITKKRNGEMMFRTMCDFFFGGNETNNDRFPCVLFGVKQDCGCLRSAGSARTTRRRGNLGEMGQLTFEPCNVDQHCNWLSLWWLLVWGCSMELSNISQVIIQLATLRLLTFMHTRQGLKYTYSWQCKQKKKMSQSLICTY